MLRIFPKEIATQERFEPGNELPKWNALISGVLEGHKILQMLLSGACSISHVWGMDTKHVLRKELIISLLHIPGEAFLSMARKENILQEVVLVVLMFLKRFMVLIISPSGTWRLEFYIRVHKTGVRWDLGLKPLSLHSFQSLYLLI